MKKSPKTIAFQSEYSSALSSLLMRLHLTFTVQMVSVLISILEPFSGLK